VSHFVFDLLGEHRTTGMVEVVGLCHLFRFHFVGCVKDVTLLDSTDNDQCPGSFVYYKR
jgi:hypothetical protein